MSKCPNNLNNSLSIINSTKFIRFRGVSMKKPIGH